MDFLFPKKCVGCKKFGEYLCPDCFAKLSFAPPARCLICGKPSFDGMTHPKCRTTYAIDGCFAAVGYKGIVRKILYQFKYNPYLTDLQTVLGDLLYEALIQHELFNMLLQQHPLLVPIPLSKSKMRKRGYNHAEVLAKNLGKRFGLSVQNILKRVKETKPQYGLKREERVENIKGAFAVVIASKAKQSHKNKITTSSSTPRNDRVALLVDDIVTTGSTLKEAAKMLKHSGFGKVYGIVLAQD